jgi:hypothetical protein
MSSRQLNPDEPPLALDGRLELPDELEALADQLRREAVSIADASLPQAPQARLLMHACQDACNADSPPDSRRGRWWLAVAVSATILLAALPFVVQKKGATPLRPADSQFSRKPPPPTASAPQVVAGQPSEAVDRDVFLSYSSGIQDEQLKAALDAAGAVTDAERIEILERALERYRSAIDYQQEQIRRIQDDLRQVREENARLRQRLEDDSQDNKDL